MIVYMLGYPLLVLLYLAARAFSHLLVKRASPKALPHLVIKDGLHLRAYFRQLYLSNPKISRIIAALMAIIFVIGLQPSLSPLVEACDNLLSLVMFFLLVVFFLPKEEPSRQGFPLEIFGFAYSLIFMFYNAGAVVVAVFYLSEIVKDNMWLYGYGVTLISYIVCIATIKGFMDRKLSNEEIVLLGMIMLATLEFITYYGIGFFSSIESYDPRAYDENLFGDITNVVNKGIYVASQSQILERSTMEVWGNIILNGTDVLTITAVLGYIMQKFLEK